MSSVIWLLVPIAVSAATIGGRRRARGRQAHTAPRELVRRALVVLPSIDDQRGVLRAIARVLETDPRVDVLVIERSSDQPSVERVSPRVRVLRQPSIGSHAEALHVGGARALTDGYDAVIELSVGHSRLARRITPLLEALDDGAHVAVGSRYVPGGRVVGCPATRRLASRGVNLALRWMTGVPVCDVTAHIRAYRRVAVERALLRADGTDRARAMGVDVMLLCRRAGLQVTEVPVTVAGPLCTAVTAAGGRQLLAQAFGARRGTGGDRGPGAFIDLAELAPSSVGR